MADIDGQSSDLLRQATNPYSEYVLYENVTTVDPVLVGSFYYGTKVIDLSFLNLEDNVPDVDAWYYVPTAVGGGQTEIAWHKLPYTVIDPTGATSNVWEHMKVSTGGYIGLSDEVDPSTFRLTIHYFNRNSGSESFQIRYKVYSKRVGGLPL